MNEKQEFEDWEIGLNAPQTGKQIRKYSPRQRPLKANEERNEVLHNLIELDIWDERLLSDALFGKTVEVVLERRERFILEMKVEGKSDEYIIKILKQASPQGNFSLDSLKSRKSEIKRKLRDGFNSRLPGWIRQKKWNNSKEEKEVRDFYDKHPEFLEEE